MVQTKDGLPWQLVHKLRGMARQWLIILLFQTNSKEIIVGKVAVFPRVSKVPIVAAGLVSSMASDSY